MATTSQRQSSATAISFLPRHEDSYESFSLLPTLSICFLTFNAVVAVFRSYAHEDYPMIAFILFIYLGFLSLFGCLHVFHRLPRQEESRRKEWLKVGIWVISTGLTLGLAIKFAPLLYPTASVFVLAMGVSASACGFYYFIYLEQGVYLYPYPDRRPNIVQMGETTPVLLRSVASTDPENENGRRSNKLKIKSSESPSVGEKEIKSLGSCSPLDKV